MLIKITSENPNLSYVIGKNPNAPPRIKELRSGYLFGWFEKPTEYCVRFIDSPDENSFKSNRFDEFSYLDTEQYSASLIPARIISELFHKTYPEHDIEYNCEFTAYSVDISDMTLSRLKNSFNVEITEVNGFYDIKFKNTSIKKLLTEAEVFFMFICYKKYNHFVDFSEKYLHKMIEVDSPYFVRYVIKNALVRNSSQKWETVQPLINTSKRWQFDFQRFNNQDVRRNFIRQNLLGGDVLIDIGCGSGELLGLSSKYTSYIGVDPDTEVLEKAKRRALVKGFDNCTFLTELPEIKNDYDVLLCEVIEHLSADEQLKMIEVIKKARKVVLTTPNKEFNQFYGIESPRREDHLNELTFDELKTLWGEAKYFQLGDKVNGISTISGLIYAN